MQPINATSPKFENTFQFRRNFSEKALNEIIRKYTLLDLKQVRHFWNIPGRWYHNWEHAQYMLGLANYHHDQIVATGCNFEALVLAIVFHDIIYVPGSKDNERLSAELFKTSRNSKIDWPYDNAIAWAIQRTEYLAQHGGPESVEKQPITYWLQTLDLYPLIVNDRKTQLFNFTQVWEEYKHLIEFDRDLFQQKQNDFLRALADRDQILEVNPTVKLEKWFTFNTDITWQEIEDELNKSFDLNP